MDAHRKRQLIKQLPLAFLGALFPALSDDQKLAFWGLGATKVKEAEERVKTIFAAHVGREEYFTGDDFDQRMQELRSGFILTTGFGAGSYISSLKINDEFKYSRVPGVRVLAGTVDGYGKVIGDMMLERENILHGYGTDFSEAVKTTAYVLFNGRYIISLAKALGEALFKYQQGVRAAQRVFNAARVVGGVFSKFNWVAALVQAVIVEGLGRLAYSVAREAMDKRATNLAIQSQIAPALSNRQRIIREYESYRSTPILGTTDPYKEMSGILSMQNDFGISANMFGNDYQATADVVNQLLLSGRISDYHGYASRSMTLSGLYGTDMTETMAQMSRITLGGDVEASSKLFEEFFSSMAGDGRIHLSQLALVSELGSFAENYVVGTKYNVSGGASNLARIHNFLNPVFGDRQTTAATRELVTGLDSVMLQGAFGQNYHVANLMARSGLSREEMLYGVTGSPDTLQKFLHGMYLELGIGGSDFDESGELNDEDMGKFIAYTNYGLNMDMSTSRATYAAYRTYVRGGSVEDVSTSYATEFEAGASEGLPENNFIKLVEQWTVGSRALSEAILDYAPILMGLDESILSMASSLGPIYMSKVTGVLSRANSRLERHPKPPSSGGRSGTSAPTGPRVSAGNASFDSIFNALVIQESGGKHYEAPGVLTRNKSSGALGITQIMPATGRSPGFGVRPLQNDSEEEYLRFGRDYLSAMIRYYNGDIIKALAAYNWGPGNVNKAVARWGENSWLSHAPTETQEYVRKILGRANSSASTYSDSTQAANHVNIDIELHGADRADFIRFFSGAYA